MIEIPRWSVHEIPLRASAVAATPYLSVEVGATFRGPDGTEVAVRGFWDGGDAFALRFTPTHEGDWTYETASAQPGLGGVRGAFRCAAPRPGAAGFVRRDPAHPAHFVRDDGGHWFMCGQTYYEALRNARAGGPWRDAIDGSLRRGMNKVRLLVHPAWANPYTPYPPASPFGSADGDDHDALDLAHRHALDAVVAYMGERGVVAELILFTNETATGRGRVFGTPEQDTRYLRYALARYAAFPNVIWCLTNEWNYTGKDRAYWDALGTLARDEDPWGREGDARRLLTIHQQTRIDWQFGDVDWPTHVCFQYGVRNGQRTQTDEWTDDPANQARYSYGDAWGNAGVAHNTGRGLPVVNDEFGYIGEPEDRSEPGSPPLARTKHRQILWGIHTAGGYAAAGDKTTYGPADAPDRPYMSGNWRDTEEYGDLARLVAFFTEGNIAYWRMAGANDAVVTGERVYVLAEPGARYVMTYAAVGGHLTLRLPPGAYAAERFDPRTGETTTLPDAAVEAGEVWEVALPDGDDWVIRLARRGDDGERGGATDDRH